MEIKEKMKKTKTVITNFIKKNTKKISNRKNGNVKLVGFKLYEVIILIAIATIIGVFSGSFLTYNFFDGNSKGARYSNNKYINEFEEAYQNVIDNYYEDVNKDELIDAAINGMLSTLDGYTSYMNKEEKEQFNERMNGEYKGIGIEFTTTGTSGSYVHKIVNVFDGTPAKAAGMQKDDIILKIDNTDAATITGTEIASYIKKDTIKEVTVIVKRNEENVTLKIKKTLIELPSVTKKTFTSNNKKVGYIKISIFADNTYTQFKDALESLETEKISSLVIDVRGNSGGYLHASKDILELFLSKGSIVYQMQSKTETVKYKDGTQENRTYPISVLIDNYSASASEIVASALKEAYGANIVGITSYGKGTVQQPSDLATGGMIKVTTNKWLTPNGNWIDKVGVTPTEEVTLNDSYASNPTDENDNQLQKAIELVTK